MKTIYVIGAVVGAVAVGAAAYGGYRMLKSKTEVQNDSSRLNPQNTERPIDTPRPNVNGLSLVNRDFTVPVIRGRLSVPVTSEPVAQNAETTDPVAQPRQGTVLRTNVLMLR